MRKPTKARRPTVVDVARRAGVSQGTVSRYLNGLPVKEDNRRRVADAIEGMNYTRNAVATAMRANNRRMIGLLVPVFDGFHARLLGELTRSLSDDLIGTLTMSFDSDPSSVSDALSYFQLHRVDCIIASKPDVWRNELLALEKQGVRIIAYDNLPDDVTFSSVTVNNREITEDAIGRLIDVGHRDIAILSGPEADWTAQQRLIGWKDAFASRGLTPPPRRVRYADWSRDDGHAAFKALCEEDGPPTAVFVSNYVMTTGVLQYCREAGISLPDDPSIISFDDVDLFEHTTPPIAGVEQPVEEIARAIKELVIRLAYGKTPGAAEHIVLPCRLNLRGSVGAPSKTVSREGS